MDEIKEEIKEEILIDEEEAKKQFLKELKNKNKEEQEKLQEIEEAKIAEEARIAAEAKAAEEAKAEAEAKALEEAKMVAYKSEETDITVTEDTKLVTNNENKVHRKFSGNTIKATVIDTAVGAVVSLAGVGLLDLILRLLFGYYVVDYKGFYIIFLLIVLILYPLVMENTKFKKTLGQKFNKAEVQERNE